MDKSIQLAELWLALQGVQSKINNEILPSLSHLSPCEDETEQSLVNDLGLAAESIRAYLAKFRLQAEGVK